MLEISKANQFLSPGQDFYLSALSPSEKSKISSIRGEASNGGLVVWTPASALPPLRVLKANRSYLIQSVLTNAGSGPTLSPYSLSINSGGHRQQNNQVTKVFQFFNYEAQEYFDLNALGSVVKSKIRRVYGAPRTSSGNLRVWDPHVFIPTLRYIESGSTYLIESVSQGFAAYDIGVPIQTSTSMNSSDLFFLNDALIPDEGLLPYAGLVP